MTAIEQELIEKIGHLDADRQRQVLEFVRQLEEKPTTYSVFDLMKLPPDERNQIVFQALARSADLDTELFEAYDESDFDDE